MSKVSVLQGKFNSGASMTEEEMNKFAIELIEATVNRQLSSKEKIFLKNKFNSVLGEVKLILGNKNEIDENLSLTKNRLDSANEEIKELSGELNSTKDKLNNASEEVKSLYSINDSNREAMKEKDNEIERLKGKINSLEFILVEQTKMFANIISGKN